ncbi:MAG: DNA repair protein RecO [Gammaproteobacteria bacterium]
MNSNQRISLQSAFVLHSRPYRESSLLLDVFTCEYGKTALIAKGARKPRTGLSAVLQPFTPIRVSWCGKSELHTLTAAEPIPPGIVLTGRNLYCGFYLNELLNIFLHRHDPHQNLFSHYAAALVALSGQGETEKILRYFELALLDEIGFGLQIEQDSENGEAIRPDRCYQYRVGQGLVESANSFEGISGTTLIGLAQRSLEGPIQLSESKKMMRTILDYHLGGKPLRSRALFVLKDVNRQRSESRDP